MNTDYEYWKEYRRKLTSELKENVEIKKDSKNIYKMAKEIGIKPTARYFNIDPSNVRYHIKKIEKEMK